MERQYSAREDAQHRHHGPHRCRQDHDHRAHPLLHRRPTRSARSTRAPPPWTGWCRSRSAASPSPRPRPPASGATTASTSSTRRPRRLHRRGGALAARARRRGRRVRAVAGVEPQIGDGVAPGRQVPACRASPSSTRWTASAPTSTASSGHDARAASARTRWPIQLPIGSEDQFRGVIDLIDEVAIVWDESDETLGKEYREVEIPADMLDQAKEYREKLVEAARRGRRAS